MRSFACFIPLSSETILPTTPGDRTLGLICLAMFVAGIWLACNEIVRWWKARLQRFELPSLASLITYERDTDKSWRATKILSFPLSQPPWISNSSGQQDAQAEVSGREDQAA